MVPSTGMASAQGPLHVGTSGRLLSCLTLPVHVPSTTLLLRADTATVLSSSPSRFFDGVLWQVLRAYEGHQAPVRGVAVLDGCLYTASEALGSPA